MTTLLTSRTDVSRWIPPKRAPYAECVTFHQPVPIAASADTFAHDYCPTCDRVVHVYRHGRGRMPSAAWQVWEPVYTGEDEVPYTALRAWRGQA